MFTTRHYRAIAEAVGKSDAEASERYKVTASLAEMFTADNPRFKAELFWQAVADAALARIAADG